MNVPTEIHTKRLILRKPESGDWFAVNQAVNESFDELKPWMGWAQRRPSMDISEQQVMEAIDRWDSGVEYRMYIIEKSSGKFVGSTGYIRTDESRKSFEIGYWCRTAMCGNGYVTEAVEALTNLALELGTLSEIKCDIDNVKSIAIAKRLGYTYDYLRVNDNVKADGSGPRTTMIFTKTRDEQT